MRIGIDLGGTKIEAAAFGDDGRELCRLRTPTPRDDYQATLQAIANLVTEIESQTGSTGSVGVGTPGALSPSSGLIKNANSTCLIGHRLDVDLEAVLARPVRVENDANCFALSEAVDGAGAGVGVVFGVIVGTGVGGGIVVNGEVLLGRNAIAGEWGHNPLPWCSSDELPGPGCYCGARGCIESYLSGPGLTREFEAASGRNMEAAAIARLAANGDTEAEACMQRYENRMARSLAHVINLLDPDVIVLGGGLSNIERLYRRVPNLWGRWVFSDQVDTPLLPPVHGDSGGVRGAAWLWPLRR
ncbi:MAG: ROK family protein [Gammaproteobacteria bacterium]|nr:ROK family protein [Gammaproteobacteria bacterium]